ncbi:antibiotic biosynthesis monooxygenase [Kutzneria buriramensis]|uniref:Heme-degrading monooxygenase HmoA n=1 Tax=Kutzneria buriramensis TaxID=1045776 RepID=A0A3E0I542_9PSEU|nr:antibiotic biosynthesis monooxygenase [Kutzneria buriramensis]REH53878.1 heme-degrading monooxygenase HmoA [Kutzneria buriramensis]
MAVVKINALEVPEAAGEELEKRFAAGAARMAGVPGFLGFELLRPVAGESRYFVYSRWESDEAFQAWQTQPRGDHGGGRPPVSTSSGVLEFEVALSVGPEQA